MILFGYCSGIEKRMVAELDTGKNDKRKEK